MTGLLRVLAFVLCFVIGGLPPLLRWCYRHWGKLLTLALAAVWVLSVIKMCGSMRYDPGQRVEVVDDFWAWMSLGMILPVCLISPLVWGQPRKPKTSKPQPLPPGRLDLPYDFFMPYCVCPQCKSEALHWLSRDRGTVRYYGADIYRECRTCKHTWAQRVGVEHLL